MKKVKRRGWAGLSRSPSSIFPFFCYWTFAFRWFRSGQPGLPVHPHLFIFHFLFYWIFAFRWFQPAQSGQQVQQGQPGLPALAAQPAGILYEGGLRIPPSVYKYKYINIVYVYIYIYIYICFDVLVLDHSIRRFILIRRFTAIRRFTLQSDDASSDRCSCAARERDRLRQIKLNRRIEMNRRFKINRQNRDIHAYILQ